MKLYLAYFHIINGFSIPTKQIVLLFIQEKVTNNFDFISCG